MASSSQPATLLFKSSVTSRRFPALKALTDDDVEVMALPPRPTPEQRAKKAAGGKGGRLFDPDLVKPSAVATTSPLAGARAGQAAGGKLGGTAVKAKPKKVVEDEDRPPFRPSNPHEARRAPVSYTHLTLPTILLV